MKLWIRVKAGLQEVGAPVFQQMSGTQLTNVPIFNSQVGLTALDCVRGNKQPALFCGMYTVRHQCYVILLTLGCLTDMMDLHGKVGFRYVRDWSAQNFVQDVCRPFQPCMSAQTNPPLALL